MAPKKLNQRLTKEFLQLGHDIVKSAMCYYPQ